MKTCTGCSNVKDDYCFHKKKENPDGLDYYCKECKAASKLRYLISIGENVNESRFKAIFNGLSSIAKKTFDAVPKDTYWSASRIANEMARTSGSNADLNIIKGCLNTLLKHGLVLESSPGCFVKVMITKKPSKPTPYLLEQAEHKMEAEMKPKVADKDLNAFDALREIAIKFMDTAKVINSLATDIDARLQEIEKQIADNAKDTDKLKQLQSLLKSLG